MFIMRSSIITCLPMLLIIRPFARFFFLGLLAVTFCQSNAQYVCRSAEAFRVNDFTTFRFEEREKSVIKPLIYSFSLMTVNLAILVGAGLSDDKMRFENFEKAFTMLPVLDDDGWFYNYFSHPLMGSETYLRAREGGFGYFESFLFSSAMSVTWEFFLESWTERPSIQDLLITSTTGSLLGELRFWAKGRMNPQHHWFIDPLNMLTLSVGKLFDKKEKTVSLVFSFTF